MNHFIKACEGCMNNGCLFVEVRAVSFINGTEPLCTVAIDEIKEKGISGFTCQHLNNIQKEENAMKRCLPVAEEIGFNAGDKIIDAMECCYPDGGHEKCRYRDGEECTKKASLSIWKKTKDGWK